jgi:predicted DCC family thiol-disulfide oxidoreductase YuxK
MTQKKKEAWIVYDGDCPFCSRYVRWLRLKENLDVHLVDARHPGALKDEATALGYDLDRGMVLKYDGNFYAGDRAMHMLALMSTPSGLFNRLMIRIFSSSARAKALYPALSAGRRAVVLMLGRGEIGNLKGGGDAADR